MAVSLLRLSLHEEYLLHFVVVLENCALHGSPLICQLLDFARGTEGERTDLAPM